MIVQAALYAGALLIAIHALIHVLGFVAYWPVTQVAQLPYKTTLLDGRWDIHAGGMRIFAIMWLVAAIGLLVTTGGLLIRQDWWRPAMISVALVSLILTVLDWTDARIGGVADIILLAGILIGPRFVNV